MVKRCTPCKECRDRRRKCVHISLHDTCTRCKRLDRECINSDEEPNDVMYDDDLLELQEQVEELNSYLTEMEKQTKSLLYDYNNKNNDNSDEDNNDKKQLIINNEIFSNSSSSSSSSNSSSNSKPWKLTLHNGTLRIETSIITLSDLLSQCLPIKYLSPLCPSPSASSPSPTDMMIRFDSGKNTRFLPLIFKMLVKCITPGFSPMQMSSPTIPNIHSTVEELINIYFHCRHPYKPLLHKKTFMQHYRGLTSPLDSLVCLCICCHVCALPCHHTSNDPYRYRQLGHIFYHLAKAKVMHQFDESSKRLENLISINLLNVYTLSMLQLDDFKNFVTIGYHLCWDLESWYEETRHQGITVERMLYSRHFFKLFLDQSFLSLITNEPMHYLSVRYPEWLLMEDEPQEIARFVSIQNYLLLLINHPYLKNIKIQIHSQLKGEPFSLTFESIIRLGDIVMEWWKDLPSKYKICDNWLDVEECKIAIDKCENNDELSLFNSFMSLMIDTYSALLQPSRLRTNNHQVLSIVQELSLQRTLHCCQILIYSQAKAMLLIDPLSCQAVLGINEHLFHTLDALIIMVSSTNSTVRTAAKNMLAQSLGFIYSSQFMKHHKVDACCSPLLKGMRGNDISSINIAEYFSYPQPWYSLLYDLVHNMGDIQTANGSISLIDSTH